VLRVLKKLSENRILIEIPAVLAELQDPDVRRLVAALEHEAPATAEDRLEVVIGLLMRRMDEAKRAELVTKIGEATRRGDQELARKLLAEQTELIKRLGSPSPGVPDAE
jgi:hypothetical protein